MIEVWIACHKLGFFIALLRDVIGLENSRHLSDAKLRQTAITHSHFPEHQAHYRL